MANDLQKLRRSAVVSTFGPGAVVDFRAGNAPVSAIAAGLEEWDNSFPPAGLSNPQTVRETRLQKKLGVHGFRLPPVLDERLSRDEPDTRRLVAVRFPGWLQCTGCDKIGPIRIWAEDPGNAYRYCASCTAAAPGRRKKFAIPVRFVLACPKGHIDDFPWHFWVGHADGCANHKGFLFLRSEKAGLAGLMLSCPMCKTSRSMDGIFSKKTWQNFANCAGRRPWLANADQQCDQKPLALQRGASNLYFPVTQSALSIPPWSDRLQEELGTYWSTLVNIADHQRAAYIEMSAQGELGHVLQELQMSPAELAAAMERRLQQYDEVDTSDLKPAEFRQFMDNPGGRTDADNEFEIRRERVPAPLDDWVSAVVRAVRLREVRALTGFTRINPPGDPDSPGIAALSNERLSWLPAIEVRGEGIFLALREERVAAWAASEWVQQRVEKIDRLYREDWRSRHGDEPPPRILTPRFVLCHTLAHALMRQLVLECGYSSASLQERIYAADGPDAMAGLLIYTATPDADGTLGGLQRQGEANRLAPTLIAGLHALEWCSSDPLCISDLMGADASFSRSSCHSCVLVPETACEEFNSFLDRALLLGTPEEPRIGYFNGLIGP